MTDATDKPDDPLAGVESLAYYCPKCRVVGEEFSGNKFGCPHCGYKKMPRLLPEPAVRKAMVEWLRKFQADAQHDARQAEKNGHREAAFRLGMVGVRIDTLLDREGESRERWEKDKAAQDLCDHERRIEEERGEGE